jgi:hypothetical protein
VGNSYLLGDLNLVLNSDLINGIGHLAGFGVKIKGDAMSKDCILVFNDPCSAPIYEFWEPAYLVKDKSFAI